MGGGRGKGDSPDEVRLVVGHELLDTPGAGGSVDLRDLLVVLGVVAGLLMVQLVPERGDTKRESGVDPGVDF